MFLPLILVLTAILPFTTPEAHAQDALRSRSGVILAPQGSEAAQRLADEEKMAAMRKQVETLTEHTKEMTRRINDMNQRMNDLELRIVAGFDCISRGLIFSFDKRSCVQP